MTRATPLLCAALSIGCGSKNREATSCDSVAKRLVELEAGDKASFMTDKERTSRAQRWIATCKPMSEAARKCVIAATTLEQAKACSSGGSAKPEKGDATAKAAWVVRGGDASDQDAKLVAVTVDGDVIAAGDFEGKLDLGGQMVTAQGTDAWVARLSPSGEVRWVKSFGGTGRDYVDGLSLGADGSITITLTANEPPRFSRVTLAPDGTATSTPIAIDQTVHAVATHANGDVVLGSRVIEPVKGTACGAMSFVIQRFATDGKRLWARCNDGQTPVTFTSEPMQLAGGPDGMTAVCAGFSGALAWSGKVAPGGDSDNDRAFVMLLDAKGEPRWVNYLNSERRALCDALAVTEDGSVAALVRGTTPGAAVTIWETDGTQRWTRSCKELVGTSEDCELSAVASGGANIVVAAQSGARTVIATIDGGSGVMKQASTFDEGTRIDSLAARAGVIVFGTRFSGTANFGAGPIESTAGSDGASMDVLVGRL